MAVYYLREADRPKELAEEIKKIIPAFASTVKVKRIEEDHFSIYVPHGSRHRMTYEIDELVERWGRFIRAPNGERWRIDRLQKPDVRLVPIIDGKPVERAAYDIHEDELLELEEAGYVRSFEVWE
jgi:hypothetical protein